MISRRSLALVTVVVFNLLSFAQVYSSDASSTVIGEAFDATGQTLLYREHHTLDEINRSRLVEYLAPGGQLIGRKQLWYGDTPLQPSFNQVISSIGQRISVDRQGLQLSVLYQSSQAQTPKQALVDVPTTAVVDAGFDELVQQQWPRLLGGQGVAFEFLVPTRQIWISLQLSPQACAGDSARLCLRIEPERLLWRWVLDPIFLEYDRSSLRLMRFSGLGNLVDDEGRGLVVDIHYRYTQSVDAVSAQLSSTHLTPVLPASRVDAF